MWEIWTEYWNSYYATSSIFFGGTIFHINQEEHTVSLSLLEYRAFSTLLMFLIMSSKMHLVSNLAAKAISKYQIIYKIGCVARHIDLHFWWYLIQLFKIGFLLITNYILIIITMFRHALFGLSLYQLINRIHFNFC